MKRSIAVLAALVAASAAMHAQAATVTLGTFNFDSTKFGDTLIESDGGTFRNSNWLNLANANPGNPGALTGANFDTGIANIGFSGAVSYTIGYGSGIVNGAGADLGVVVARYSTDDFSMSFDGGSSFNIGAGSAVNTGVFRNYFYGGGGPYGSTLFVHMIDLSDYGFAAGASISSVSITSGTQLDLIRVAGVAAVPEPETYALLLAGLGLVGVAARRRRG